MELNITSEILNVLFGEEIHARALAKRLDINHMTVMRNLKELVRENVLEFRKEGRNKVYFLKKNMEARNYELISELYKLNKTLEKYPELRKTIKNIQQNKEIGLAILFGSYAKGTANKNSDIDVFIETKDRNLKKELELLNSRLSVKIGEYDRSSPLIKEIEKNHIIIKGAEIFYEKIGFLQ
ncbi:MAG TPA: nucleotidyltransferase domain-containing protein [Candidatus Methanoperedens sp.]|nr:nucleotidyltransferase domain-containing protein [Candidatus Methanoperedens sp.]HLB69413.1 nucleotidyltransferase domain-containing protein [Candidatus Methanoperedens sp.]